MDDDGDEAIANYDREEEDGENIEYRELDIDNLVLEASQVDTTGICTIATERRKDLSESNDNEANKNPTSCKLHIFNLYIIISQ